MAGERQDEPARVRAPQRAAAASISGCMAIRRLSDVRRHDGCGGRHEIR